VMARGWETGPFPFSYLTKGHAMSEKELLEELAAQLEDHPHDVEFFYERMNGDEKRVYISDVKFVDGVVKVVLSNA